MRKGIKKEKKKHVLGEKDGNEEEESSTNMKPDGNRSVV
jgi:hypothetical protein